MNRLTIVADSHVPYLESLNEIADLRILAPTAIDRAAVADADALIVRTRTRCNADLLEGSRVRFVGTATIGLDHIDQTWCAAHGITAVNAPGCNAPAVAQYVFSSLMQLVNRPLRQYTLGIVGVGHVGRIVERWARSLEMPVLLCDPPRQRAEGGDGWSTLDELAHRADIITFHTPLTYDGQDPSYHLADSHFFNSLRRAPIVINAARGPVADTEAWKEAIRAGVVGASVVDCWEGEPNIDLELLDMADIATPHIAGYSEAGKKRASQMVIDALTDCFGLPRLNTGLCVPPVPSSITPGVALNGYNPLVDTDMLRDTPCDFESLRDHYHLRRELREAIAN